MKLTDAQKRALYQTGSGDLSSVFRCARHIANPAPRLDVMRRLVNLRLVQKTRVHDEWRYRLTPAGIAAREEMEKREGVE